MSVLWVVGSLWVSVSDSPCGRVQGAGRLWTERAGRPGPPDIHSLLQTVVLHLLFTMETVLPKSPAQDLGCTTSGLHVSAAVLWLRERRRRRWQEWLERLP